MSTEDAAKRPITIRKMSTHPMRWPSFAPVITSAATASPYITIVVLAIVGGTPNSLTMPPSEIGRAATLNDMSTWARKRLTSGIQEVFVGAGAMCVMTGSSER